jgi:hypothetical protein
MKEKIAFILIFIIDMDVVGTSRLTVPGLQRVLAIAVTVLLFRILHIFFCRMQMVSQ